MTTKRLIAILCAFTILISLCNIGFADTITDFQPLMPKHGTHIRTIGRLTIDFSNYNEGYVMLKTEPTDKKMKIVVIHEDKDRIQYDLNMVTETITSSCMNTCMTQNINAWNQSR